MKRIVVKFGGSSVETIDKMRVVVRKIVKMRAQYDQVVVVVSAMGKTTDQLYRFAKSVVQFPKKRELDVLLSTGEQISIALLSMLLNDAGYSAVSLTGPQAGIQTQGLHTVSYIDKVEERRILDCLKEDHIVVVAGYQGVNPSGDITTLGREGSDTTAVALAIKLECPCHIYTDVSGIYQVDPKTYVNAKKMKEITYQEVELMARLGAKVVAYSAIIMAKKFKLPIYVASTYQDEEGTWIKDYMEEKEVQKKIHAITSIPEVIFAKFAIGEEISKEKVEQLYLEGIKLEVINEIEEDGRTMEIMAFGDDLDETMNKIELTFKNDMNELFEIHRNFAAVSLIMNKIDHQENLLPYLLNLFENQGIKVEDTIKRSSSMTFLVKKENVNEVVCTLAEVLSKEGWM